MFWAFSRPHLRFATAACHFSTSELPKVLQTPRVLCIFISTRAFRHSSVHFFNIRTSKSAPGPPVFLTFSLPNVRFATAACNFSTAEPKMTSFVHVHFPMCVSPQRRAIFRQQNFKKCSDTVSFWAFSLPNVLFATAACNLWYLLSAPTSAPAALTGLLFDWPDTRIIEKTQHFATSLTFGADVSSFFWLSRYCIFFLLTWLLYSAFQLSILSEVSI